MPLIVAVVDVAAAFGGRSLDVRERDPVLHCTRYLEKESAIVRVNNSAPLYPITTVNSSRHNCFVLTLICSSWYDRFSLAITYGCK